MYFPYIRGKQYELIALRELSTLFAQNRDFISPIIEPVKDSSTLGSTLRKLAEDNINFTVIANPSHGGLINNFAEIIRIILENTQGYNNYQIGILLNEGDDLNPLLDALPGLNIPTERFSLIHNSIRQDLAEINNRLGDGNVVYNVINFSKTDRRYHREFPNHTKVSLDDYFIAQQKNKDYLPIESDRFSNEHLYYGEENFCGFSDFITVGDRYSEDGFAPYAVAIHWSYVHEGNVIRIAHFVSDSNEDFHDVAGKYAEALEKMMVWVGANGTGNISETIILGYNENEHFPGLGVLKKLSIMNHIEVVLSLLNP